MTVYTYTATNVVWNTNVSPDAATIVGGSGAWNDASDATYVDLTRTTSYCQAASVLTPTSGAIPQYGKITSVKLYVRAELQSGAPVSSDSVGWSLAYGISDGISSPSLGSGVFSVTTPSGTPIVHEVTGGFATREINELNAGTMQVGIYTSSVNKPIRVFQVSVEVTWEPTPLPGQRVSSQIYRLQNPHKGDSPGTPTVVGGTTALADDSDATYVDIADVAPDPWEALAGELVAVGTNKYKTGDFIVDMIVRIKGAMTAGATRGRTFVEIATELDTGTYTYDYGSAADYMFWWTTTTPTWEQRSVFPYVGSENISGPWLDGTVQLGIGAWGVGDSVRIYEVEVELVYLTIVHQITESNTPFTIGSIVPDPNPDTLEQPVWVNTEDEADVPTPVLTPQNLADIGAIRRISEIFPSPTLDSTTGRPVNWTPTSVVDEVWGKVGILINGVNVSTVRGVKTLINDLSFQEPFGEGPGSVVINGASWWDYGAVGFEWLSEEADVDINQYDINGNFVRPLWSGIVLTVRVNGEGGWDLGLEGTFAGISGMLPHRPKLTEKERDWGIAMTYAARRAGRASTRRKSITEVAFGITTRDRGARSETLLEYITRGLSMCQTDDGNQWTLARVTDVNGDPIQRKYGWRLKDRVTQHVTVRNGQRGVTIDLTRDLSDVVRLIMGEGVSRDGARWRNTKLPNVGKETVPPYPGYPLELGMHDDDNVRVWQAEVLSDGWMTGDLDALIDGDFGTREVTAAKDIQERAGLPVTGIVNQATWNATWSNGDPDLNLGGARFDPIWSDARVRPWTYSSNGSVMAVNPLWDRSLLPLGRFVSYGQDVTKAQGRRSAKAEVLKAADPGWMGTITFRGVDPQEMSRLDILEGMNIKVLNFAGDPLLHISGIRWQRGLGGWDVVLTVDEKARDLLTIAEIRNRNREAKLDPARQALAQLRRSKQDRDTPATWDSEGGFGVLPERVASPGWNVFKIAAGKYGSLSRVRFKVWAPESRFCVSLFGAKVTKSWLKSNFPTPLADPGTEYLYWDRPGFQQKLRDVLFIETFGGWQQAGGYSPGYETHPATGNTTGDPITGVLDSSTSTDYVLDEEPKMYVAIYIDANEDVKVKGQVYLLPNE